MRSYNYDNEAMTIRDTLLFIKHLQKTQNDGTPIQIAIEQPPIPEIDPTYSPVLRYTGDINTCLDSNQNFLDFESNGYCFIKANNKYPYHSYHLLAIPSPAQINAHRSIC